MSLDRIFSLEEKARLRQDVKFQTLKLKLNLGCGGKWMPKGIINVDCRNLVPPAGIMFFRADISDLRDGFLDGCADEIWALDVLEHFPQAQARSVLAEWIRLLAPAGLLHLKTPEMFALAQYILTYNIGHEAKAYRIYGDQSYDENYHRAAFSQQMLVTWLNEMGMKVLTTKIAEDTNVAIEAVKAGSKEKGNGTRYR